MRSPEEQRAGCRERGEKMRARAPARTHTHQKHCVLVCCGPTRPHDRSQRPYAQPYGILGAERVPSAMNGYRSHHHTLLRPTHPAGCRQACIRLLLGGWRGGGREEPVQKQRAAHACDMSGERWGEMGRYGEIWGRQRSTSWTAARSRSRVSVRVRLGLGLWLGLRLGLE